MFGVFIALVYQLYRFSQVYVLIHNIDAKAALVYTSPIPPVASVAGRETATFVAVSAFYSTIPTMRMYVYVDGFNLYYGCLKGSPYKWLNLQKLSQLLFPNHTVAKIKYFTAPIKIRENDRDHDKPNRQQIYLRALRTIPDLEIIQGTFLSHVVNMRYADGTGYARVIKTEEKGTDVNIASHLINDGRKGEYDIAVVISNDSDLVEPVKIRHPGNESAGNCCQPF